MFLKELNLLILCHKFPSWFVLVGTLMESDMALITAGYNAYLGEFNLVRLILVMLIITVCTNQLFFFIGKKYKNKIEDFMEEKKEHFIAKKIQKVYV
jgi:membrane protein DedA with SNARE-associated domain